MPAPSLKKKVKKEDKHDSISRNRSRPLTTSSQGVGRPTDGLVLTPPRECIDQASDRVTFKLGGLGLCDPSSFPVCLEIRTMGVWALRAGGLGRQTHGGG